MWRTPPQGSERSAWFCVALWTLTIFATIPFARTLQGWISVHLGRSFYSLAVYGTVAAAILLVLLATRLKSTHLSAIGTCWLLAVGTAYAWFTHALHESPEEALHFIEYGMLSLLLARAFAYRVRDPSLYVSAALTGLFIGAFDETIQWITPRRFWDFRDIGINAAAVILMQIAIARGLQPPWVGPPVPKRSKLIVCRLVFANLALLWMCVSGTPDRVAWLISNVPCLRHIDESMIEYGYRHTDPFGNIFFSRLTDQELQEEDKLHGSRAALILDEYHDPRKYEAFLHRYTVLVDPFLHEARVHFFRRDRYLGEGNAPEIDEELRRDLRTIAFRENQILESCFSNTLHRSAYVFSDDVIRMLEQSNRRDVPYISAVSSGIVTRMNERRFHALFLAAMLAVMIIHGYYGRRNA